MTENQQCGRADLQAPASLLPRVFAWVCVGSRTGLSSDCTRPDCFSPEKFSAREFLVVPHMISASVSLSGRRINEDEDIGVTLCHSISFSPPFAFAPLFSEFPQGATVFWLGRDISGCFITPQHCYWQEDSGMSSHL